MAKRRTDAPASVTLVTMLALALLGIVSQAAADGSWFGLRMPSERTGAWHPAIRDQRFQLDWGPLTLRLPAAEDPYRHLQAAEILAHLEDLVAIAESSREEGVAYWGRIVGSPHERRAAEYVAEKLREFGLEEVRLDTFDTGSRWRANSWELTLLGDRAYGEGTRDYTFTDAYPAFGSAATPPEGIEAELEYVGIGHPRDLAGRDLAGKVAVVHSYLQPSPNAHTGALAPELMARAGAAGYVVVLDFNEPLQFVPILTGVDKLPGLSLNGIAGSFLEDVATRVGAEPPPRVRMKVDTEWIDHVEGVNALGMIRGEIDEYVVFVAHTDTWFQGAIDNGGGLAIMLALARHWSRPEAPKPRRNILFVATCGHHVGSYGVKDLIARYPEIMAKTVYAVNCEHVAAVWTYQFARSLTYRWTNVEAPLTVGVSNRSPLLLDLLRQAIDRYGIVIDLDTSHYPGGDPFPFWEAGVPVINMIGLPTYYHTTRDLPEVMSAPGLERVARAVAWLVDRSMASSRAALERGATRSPW
jgi:hypothetical protein